MKLAPQQELAFKEIIRWYNDDTADRIFTLGGYAGTGKTTMAKFIADEIKNGDDEKKGRVLFCAFTGKAALNLREKGLSGASTIHRMIYKRDESNPNKIQWFLDYESVASKAKLIIVDEYSMLNKPIIDDLLAVSECKILCLGDPAQLPPVEGESPLSPNMMLTEVHRQALESPVLLAATFVRENGKLPESGSKNEQGCFSLMRPNQPPLLIHQKFNQILVATNNIRQSLNQEIRKAIYPNCDINPRVNDKIICLQNNYNLDIYNGQVGHISHLGKGKELILEKAKINIADTEITVNMLLNRNMKAQKSAEYYNYTDFDYGYAITCHKAQGSEWDNVAVFPGNYLKKEWLYTAITRSRKNCVVFL